MIHATPEEFERVKQKCDAFRKAIHLCSEDADCNIAWFQYFPVDCCDFASPLLYILLFESGGRGLRLVRVRFDHDRSHEWVEWKDLIIDITADQFPEFDTYVLTRESTWHSSKEVVKGIRDQASELETYEDLIANPAFQEWRYAIMQYWSE